MFTWGNTALKVKRGTYQAPFSSMEIAEIEIIPGANGEGLSSLQSGSRDRKKPAMRIKLNSISEYQILYNEHLLSTQKTLTDMYGNTLNTIIFSIGVPEEIGFNWIECDIQFIEV